MTRGKHKTMRLSDNHKKFDMQSFANYTFKSIAVGD